jgi:hypothetical protein
MSARNLIVPAGAVGLWLLWALSVPAAGLLAWVMAVLMALSVLVAD